MKNNDLICFLARAGVNGSWWRQQAMSVLSRKKGRLYKGDSPSAHRRVVTAEIFKLAPAVSVVAVAPDSRLGIN